jgi:hypothetical protein
MKLPRLLTATAPLAAAVLLSAPAANAADAGTPNHAPRQLGHTSLADIVNTVGTLDAYVDKLDVINDMASELPDGV